MTCAAEGRGGTGTGMPGNDETTDEKGQVARLVFEVKMPISYRMNTPKESCHLQRRYLRMFRRKDSSLCQNISVGKKYLFPLPPPTLPPSPRPRPQRSPQPARAPPDARRRPRPWRQCARPMRGFAHQRRHRRRPVRANQCRRLEKGRVGTEVDSNEGGQ